MKFNPTKFSVKVAYKLLRDEFDVRVDGSISMEAAEEIAKAGSIRNPVVTNDWVFLDGRTGALGQLIANETIGTAAELCTVDVLPYAYDDLSNAEKAEFYAEALKRNFSRVYRRLATEDDCVKVISDLIDMKRTKSQWPSKAEIKDLVSFLGSRFESQYTIAKNMVTQRLISQARQLMKEDSSLSPLNAAKKVGLPNADGIIQTQGKAARDKTFNELKKKQAILTRAIAAIAQYATRRIQRLQDGTVSGLTVSRLLEYETKQMDKLVKTHESAKDRVTKVLRQTVPSFHTK